MRYVKAALMCVALCCMGRAETDGAMRRLGDLRRSDYVVTSLDGVTNDIAGLRAGLGSVSDDVSDLRVAVSALGGVTNGISGLVGFTALSNRVAGLQDGLAGVSGGLAAAVSALSNLSVRSTISWDAADGYFCYLEDYATNNYMAARLANYRALRLELWRQGDTNRVAGLRGKADNMAHAASYSDWDVYAYTADSSDWALEFTPAADDAAVGTWSLMSGTNILGYTYASMSKDAVAIATNDWAACSVDPLPTAARTYTVTPGASFATYDAVLSLFWDRAPALTSEQAAAGVTYVKKGKVQDAAIAIGPHAKAALRADTAAAARPKEVLRSVSVAIGGYADAQPTNGTLGQAIAIGYCSQAKGVNAIAIGSGAQHFDESAMDGGAAVAAGINSTAVGYSAKALADGSVQLGSGVNRTPESLQFMGVPIVQDGKLAVQADVRTNDVQNLIRDALSPQVVESPLQGEVVPVKSHTITTLMPTGAIPDEVTVSPTMDSNYELYVPNTPAARRGLPIRFALDPDYTNGVTRLGPWWGRRATRLPLLVKVRTPFAGTVLLDVETYDDGTDWTPGVTNAAWIAVDGGTKLASVAGTNLHTVASVVMTYTNSADEVVIASTTNIVPTYGVVSLHAPIGVTDLKAGTAPVVTVTPASAAGYRTLNSVLDEKNAGWR